MMATGEKSGNLGETLRKVAEYYDHEAGHAIERLSKVIPLFIYLGIMGAIGYQIIMFYVNRYSGFM